MRHIGNVPTEQQARLFGDYLYARGIRNEVEPDGDNSWMIWVADEAQLAAARGLLERFQHNPSSAEFAHDAAGAEALRSDEARDLAAYRKRFYTRQQIFPGTRSFGAGVLTYALVVACVMVSLFSKFGHDDALLRFLYISYPQEGASGILPEVRSGEVWRLFTPAIIHFGFAHLLFNMMWLFQLGSMIEGRQGHLQFAVLVLVLAAGSNVPQYVVHGPSFGGMSGVIYGLFGYVWLRGRFDRGSGLYIDRQNVILMIVWFFLCLTGWIGPIANVAHGAGLVLGAAWGFVSAMLARSRHE
jgi:GlpG protein